VALESALAQWDDLRRRAEEAGTHVDLRGPAPEG
jgi:hypothetical protein